MAVARNFPLRNRIISGLCDKVVVVEAKDKSGSLITADYAMEQGKDVYVVPGRITDPLSRGCNRLIKQGAGIIYDIDDYIFDYAQIADQEFLKDVEYRDFETYAQKINECMSCCDVFTTSTENLAKGIRESFPDKQVMVCRNVANLEMQLLSEIAYAQRKKERHSDKVILGYFSGSKTHNKDWKIIEDSVIEVMDRNANVELLIGGVLDISGKMQKYKERIKQFPFGDWRKLPKLISSIDINLMPLENTFFQWCKSENKWMEAGLVGIPTIASWNPELSKVMEDGENVIFCDSPSTWTEQLQRLVNEKKVRLQIGENARNEVYSTHLVTSCSDFVDYIG